MKVRLSGDDRAYLLKEATYLRRHNKAAAEAFVSRIALARESLAAFPESGFGTDRLPIPNVRRLVVGGYLLDYELDEKGVLVTSIRHGAQRPLAPDYDADFDYEADEQP